jgi:hypothetical protein
MSNPSRGITGPACRMGRRGWDFHTSVPQRHKYGRGGYRPRRPAGTCTAIHKDNRQHQYPAKRRPVAGWGKPASPNVIIFRRGFPALGFPRHPNLRGYRGYVQMRVHTSVAVFFHILSLSGSVSSRDIFLCAL